MPVAPAGDTRERNDGYDHVKDARKREGSMDGQTFTGGVRAAPPKVKAGDIPTTTFDKTGVTVSVIAQGGARMDLHPEVPAAAHVGGSTTSA